MHRRTLIPAVLVLAVLTAAAPATAAASERFSFVVSAGWFRPSSPELRSLYGSAAVPLSVRAAFRFWGPVSIFAGYQSLRLSGTTVIVGPSFEDERYALRLTRNS
jgi:hypothetical protein